MILVVDVGNTNIVLGLYERETLRFHWRVATNRSSTADEYGILICSLFQHAGVRVDDVEGVMISSVVPPVNAMLDHMCRKYVRRAPAFVGPGIKTGLNIRYENPREVGADRIVNAVAGIHKYGSPLIVVDFGTATTFCYIDEKGDYIGGAIAPGIGISTEALYQRAAKLPRIELARPRSTVGRTTVASMQSGIIFGFAGQVDGIVERIREEFGTRPRVVATGGLAEMIAGESKTIDTIDPLLTLEGLRLIYERNRVK
ncbi:type III pantothenate kinase [Paenibacillus antri]|uniref:Type III pantothenate kinase n=1 Tax=Paenibacillus antri TaxID=2582848 RepID=A0A5R9G0U7_9BACL|nr:type III pantothenate kinase [Paenibacillus antri]TLS48619.1 type III pantothenate kinase [Paenibacillus antri]